MWTYHPRLHLLRAQTQKLLFLLRFLVDVLKVSCDRLGPLAATIFFSFRLVEGEPAIINKKVT